MIDKERFAYACEKIIGIERERIGIGTLSEKTLHAVLKYYFEPMKQYHEIKIGNFFADISNNGGIIEIQSRSFDAMRKKLEIFLPLGEVLVVYPVPQTKWLCWIDTQTGEVTSKRKSPKKGLTYDILPELYRIKNLLLHENLRFCIVLLDVLEYRNLDGWSRDKKKGSSRHERIPTEILDEVYINCPSDYRKLVPENMPTEFTSKDFKKAARLSPRGCGYGLNVLTNIGAIERIGKKGNAFIYHICGE